MIKIQKKELSSVFIHIYSERRIVMNINTILTAWQIFQIIFVPAGFVLSMLDIRKRCDAESKEKNG